MKLDICRDSALSLANYKCGELSVRVQAVSDEGELGRDSHEQRRRHGEGSIRLCNLGEPKSSQKAQIGELNLLFDLDGRFHSRCGNTSESLICESY